MIRLILIPVLLLILGVLLLILSIYTFRKFKRATKKVIKQGSEFTKEFAADQQKKWSQKEQRSQLPKILQKAYLQFDEIEKNSQTLPNHWQNVLTPVVDQANVILLAVSTKPKLSGHIKPFFHHSLDSLLQFINKLNSDHHQMNDQQTEMARQNVTLFKADLINHQKTLNKQKQFDFDVLMDVIKARLKQ